MSNFKTGVTHTPSSSTMRRIVIASVFGNALEWYDFFLYGTAAALIFGPLFFPAGTDPVLGTMGAFAGFAVGFFARPLGGIIFGHIGDRSGRKKALVMTLSIMGVSTFLMGLLPTFEQAGYLAPVTLVLLRIAQGIASGGEWGGGVLMISENAPANRVGFYAAWSQLGVSGGFVLSAAAFYLVQMLPHEDFMSWGWRLPFLASVLVFGVGIYIRRNLPESRDFEDAAAQRATVKHPPAMEVLRKHPREVFQAMGLRMAENSCAYIFLAFVMAYAKLTGLNTQTVLGGVTVAMIVEAFTIFLGLAVGFHRPTHGLRHWLDQSCIVCVSVLLANRYPRQRLCLPGTAGGARLLPRRDDRHPAGADGRAVSGPRALLRHGVGA